MKTILFVPGYYGSYLLDADSKEKVWITIGQALFNKKTLAVPIAGMEIPGARELIPGDLIEQVSVFMAYGRTKSFLEKLAGEKGWKFAAVSYDWRKDPLEGIRRIDEAVRRAKSSTKDEVYLIGHSQGAWLCGYYLRFGAQDYFADSPEQMETWDGLKLVDKVILAAGPYRGTMSLLRNTFYGIPIGTNLTLQSPLFFSTAPSSYYLLPPKEQMLALDEKLQPLSLDLHDPEFWREKELGLFQPRFEFSKNAQAVAFDFLKNHLSRSQRLHELMHAPSKKEAPPTPFLSISGQGRATMERGIRHDETFLYYPRHIKKYRSDVSSRVTFVDGDGTLSAETQVLPQAFLQLKPQIVSVQQEHLELLQSASSKKLIADFLLTEKRQN
jgi:pimeloyl-ACP methyl ester carboxylesterase